MKDLCTATGTLRNNLKYSSRDSLSVLSISGFWIQYNNLAFKGSTVLATTLWDVDSVLGGWPTCPGVWSTCPGGMVNLSRGMVNGWSTCPGGWSTCEGRMVSLVQEDGQLVQGGIQLVQGGWSTCPGVWGC